MEDDGNNGESSEGEDVKIFICLKIDILEPIDYELSNPEGVSFEKIKNYVEKKADLNSQGSQGN